MGLQLPARPYYPGFVGPSHSLTTFSPTKNLQSVRAAVRFTGTTPDQVTLTDKPAGFLTDIGVTPQYHVYYDSILPRRIRLQKALSKLQPDTQRPGPESDLAHAYYKKSLQHLLKGRIQRALELQHRTLTTLSSPETDLMDEFERYRQHDALYRQYFAMASAYRFLAKTREILKKNPDEAQALASNSERGWMLMNDHQNSGLTDLRRLPETMFKPAFLAALERSDIDFNRLAQQARAKAEAHFMQSGPDKEELAGTYLELAAMVAEADSPNAAIPYYQKATEISPENYFQLGRAYQNIGNYTDAIQAYFNYESYLSLPPDEDVPKPVRENELPRLYYRLAQCYEQLGNLEMAMVCYKKVTPLYSADAMNGIILEALKLAEVAVDNQIVIHQARHHFLNLIGASQDKQLDALRQKANSVAIANRW